MSVIQPRKHVLGRPTVGPCFAYVEVGVIHLLFANEETLAQESYGTNSGSLGW